MGKLEGKRRFVDAAIQNVDFTCTLQTNFHRSPEACSRAILPAAIRTESSRPFEAAIRINRSTLPKSARLLSELHTFSRCEGGAPRACLDTRKRHAPVNASSHESQQHLQPLFSPLTRYPASSRQIVPRERSNDRPRLLNQQRSRRKCDPLA